MAATASQLNRILEAADQMRRREEDGLGYRGIDRIAGCVVSDDVDAYVHGEVGIRELTVRVQDAIRHTAR